MNWLAHIFISKDHIDYQLGNLLADPLKGRSWQGAAVQFQDGLKMHGSIDAFTDAHALVARSKARLGEKGYLKGVVIDLAYDYLLLKNWDSYARVGVEPFIHRFYRDAESAIQCYPDHARHFVSRVIHSNYLTSYGSFAGLAAALQRIDYRLSARVLARESAQDYLPALRKEMTGIEADFKRFFPDLIDHFKRNAGPSQGMHWLK
ncbi:MAG: acyl carrier protein phosphodiesterase [Gammaproteobacteria bacterium]|nr:acyl carrier protein phosphodiesterase [Gammaproteobacteria bacterium]MDH5652642.1 acyl carrier protein phosphodiesterase [Gammaproteobacteria bacterium]